MEKQIKIDKPMPAHIRLALQEKREWREKIQGESSSESAKSKIQKFRL